MPFGLSLGLPKARDPPHEPGSKLRRREARAALLRFLERADKELWGVSADVRRQTLEDLDSYVTRIALRRTSRPGPADVESVLGTLSDPAEIGAGTRAFYGYGGPLQALMILLAFALAAASLPAVGILALAAFVVACLVVTFAGNYGGFATGVATGIAAALGRGVAVLLTPALIPGLEVHLTGPGAGPFALATALLLVPGALAGYAHRREVLLTLGKEFGPQGDSKEPRLSARTGRGSH